MILNYAEDINSFSPPLMLGIQGAKGEGKSFMVERLCEYYSIEYIPISGSELCGNLEGDSVKKLISEYERACIRVMETREFSCIVIDDFHKSLAASSQNHVYRTSNSDTLVGRLMNLSDNPYVYDNRIPIILTGNNFTTIYPALTRHGRMELFDWVPSIEEKERIVFGIFQQYYPGIGFDAVSQLVRQYNDYYVAFFKTLIQDVFWEDFSTIVDAFHAQRSCINLDNITHLIRDNLNVHADLSIERIFSLAELRSRKVPKNYEGGTHGGRE